METVFRGTRALLLTAVLGAGSGCKDEIIPLNGGINASAATGEGGDGTDDVLQGWDGKPRAIAQAIIQEYGLPEDAVAGSLHWGARGPWKRIVVYKEDLPHNFPTPHSDVLEQVIDAHIAADRVSALAAFDGSIVVDRTAGEIFSRCEDEGANFLALNLAMDVVASAKTPAEARQAFADIHAAGGRGEPQPQMKGLLFSPPSGNQGDPDVALP